MLIKTLDKQDTFLIKGIAILSILLHNFFHWIAPFTGENEFDFSSDRIMNLFSSLQSSPLEFINVIFSYFGHYGVQLFIFISAYGLAISFSQKPCSWGRFMLDRLTKLYPLLLTAIIIYFFAMIVLEQRLLSIYDWKEIEYKLLFIHTLLPDSGLSLNGPWWFFALIFQLYLLFPLLFKLIKKYSWKAFISILILSYILIYISLFVYQPNEHVTLMQNAPGHLPEFALGIFFALNKEKKINPFLIITALVLFVLGNFFEVFFPFSFLSLTFLLLAFFNLIKPYIEKTKLVYRTFLYFGEISMLLFAVHGFFRLPFIALNNQWNSFYGALFVAILFVLTVIGVSLISQKFYDYIVSIFRMFTKYIIATIEKVSFKHKIYNIIDILTKVGLIILFLWLSLRLFIHHPLKEMINMTYDMDTVSHEVFKPYLVRNEKDNKVLLFEKDFSVLAPDISINWKYKKIILYLSFDFQIKDSITKLPVVVLSIEKNKNHYYWNERPLCNNLRESLKAGEWEHFSTTFEIESSALRIKKYKDLKLFLFRNQGSLYYDNIHIKLMAMK